MISLVPTSSHLTSCRVIYFILYFSDYFTRSRFVLGSNVPCTPKHFEFPISSHFSIFSSLRLSVRDLNIWFFYKAGLLALHLTSNLEDQTTPTTLGQDRAIAMYFEYIGQWGRYLPNAG